jgi:hypothetical protein
MLFYTKINNSIDFSFFDHKIKFLLTATFEWNFLRYFVNKGLIKQIKTLRCA